MFLGFIRRACRQQNHPFLPVHGCRKRDKNLHPNRNKESGLAIGYVAQQLCQRGLAAWDHVSADGGAEESGGQRTVPTPKLALTAYTGATHLEPCLEAERRKTYRPELGSALRSKLCSAHQEYPTAGN